MKKMITQGHRGTALAGDYPDFAQFLVHQAIDNISLNPDTVLKTMVAILATELVPARLLPCWRQLRRLRGGESGENPLDAMMELTQNTWHELPEPEVVRLLESDLARGLTDAEVGTRLRQFGPNEMTAQKRTSEWKRFLLQFAQPLMYILLLASAVTLFLGEYVDSAVIFAVTFINALVGFFQESKAEQAIEALSKMVLTEATVRREGRRQRVDSTGLVPGDIVVSNPATRFRRTCGCSWCEACKWTNLP